MIHPALYTEYRPAKGWGVFTREAIPAGTVVELSPVIVMSAADKEVLDKTLLYNYIFDWEHGYCCMGMGYLPVYNHNNPSNCEYFQDYTEGTIFVKTMRDLNPGEELTINYNGDFDSNKPVWFDLKQD